MLKLSLKDFEIISLAWEASTTVQYFERSLALPIEWQHIIERPDTRVTDAPENTRGRETVFGGTMSDDSNHSKDFKPTDPKSQMDRMNEHNNMEKTHLVPS